MDNLQRACRAEYFETQELAHTEHENCIEALRICFRMLMYPNTSRYLLANSISADLSEHVVKKFAKESLRICADMRRRDPTWTDDFDIVAIEVRTNAYISYSLLREALAHFRL